MFEQCDKNCLGGCPNTGPGYCYYGVLAENDCLFYVKSRLTALFNYSMTDKRYNDFDYEEVVTVNGTVDLYEAYLCRKTVHRNDPPYNDEAYCFYYVLNE